MRTSTQEAQGLGAQAVVHLLFLLCFAAADCSAGAEIQQLALIVKQFAALYISLSLSSLCLSLSLSLSLLHRSLSLPVPVPLMYLSPSLCTPGATPPSLVCEVVQILCSLTCRLSLTRSASMWQAGGGAGVRVA